jgi:hypothetical protein
MYGKGLDAAFRIALISEVELLIMCQGVDDPGFRLWNGFRKFLSRNRARLTEL